VSYILGVFLELALLYNKLTKSIFKQEFNITLKLDWNDLNEWVELETLWGHLRWMEID